VIDGLPRVFGVQSAHADPVFRYYSRPPEAREYQPVTVRPSVAQAAMIGNPVSMPRVLKLAQAYERRAGQARFFVVQVEEQDIMDMMLTANRRGHVACTQGGESLAGLKKALALGLMDQDGVAVLDSTAHALKFADFQNRYFEDDFGPEFEVRPREELKNHPQAVVLDGVVSPGSGRALSAEETAEYVAAAAAEIARRLGLKAK
jgi:threonine synthase